MMLTLAPVWDESETWLVLAGAALFPTFRTTYGIAPSALYLPIILMVVCLVYRGVSFEVRGKASRTKNAWSLTFILGSLGATFSQGIILHADHQRILVANGSFSGDRVLWLAPFSLLTGFGLMSTYALLGACWRMRMSTILRGRRGLAFACKEVMNRLRLKKEADCLIRQHTESRCLPLPDRQHPTGAPTARAV